MQKIVKITALALIALSLIATGCSSTRGGGKHSCGCTGMVGYK